MPYTIESAISIAREEADIASLCLWPKPFRPDTPEAAWAFVSEVRTGCGKTKSIPDRPELREFARRWHEHKRSGDILATEKDPQIPLSWTARALELHQMGLGPCRLLMIAESPESAANQIGRLILLYTELRSRHPEWQLPEPNRTALETFSLPNGSECTLSNPRELLSRRDYQVATIEGATLFVGEWIATFRSIAVKRMYGAIERPFIHLIGDPPQPDAQGADSWRLLADPEPSVEATKVEAGRTAQ